ncbi:MSCRAMM family adhesin SdrC [Clostridioides difficile]|nr:MSCRAMM family adhesin SdrC [Clostridioides difficile]
MRWILVFIFLYLIPLIVIFRNYKNFKRSCIYSSIYVVLATTIMISNIYMSGLNKIKESMYYHNYISDETYDEKYVSNFNEKEDKDLKQDKKDSKELNNKNVDNVDSKQDKNTQSTENNNEENKKDLTKDNDLEKNTSTNSESEKQGNTKENSDNYTSKENDSEDIKKIDLESIGIFKKEIYNIERVALVPMRECIPYTKDLAKSITRLSSIKKDVTNARNKCKEVIEEYENMQIPELSKDEYTNVLSSARDDVKKAYELRQKSMDSALKLINTKSPKYIGRITEYLDLSDKQIESFKNRLNDLNEEIDGSNTID